MVATQGITIGADSKRAGSPDLPSAAPTLRQAKALTANQATHRFPNSQAWSSIISPAPKALTELTVPMKKASNQYRLPRSIHSLPCAMNDTA